MPVPVTAFLYRPPAREVLLDGTPYRLVPGTAPDGLVLRAAAKIDFSPPFNIAPAPPVFNVGVRKSERGSGWAPLTSSFFSQSVQTGPREAALRRAAIANG